MHQPLLGAAFPLALALLVYALRRGRCSLAGLIVTPLAMAFCAFWAVAPDVPRLLRIQGLYRRLAQDPRTDIFFWHYSIDRIEAARLDAMTPVFNACFALLLAALLAAAWRELHRAEHPPTPRPAIPPHRSTIAPVADAPDDAQTANPERS